MRTRTVVSHSSEMQFPVTQANLPSLPSLFRFEMLLTYLFRQMFPLELR